MSSAYLHAKHEMRETCILPSTAETNHWRHCRVSLTHASASCCFKRPNPTYASVDSNESHESQSLTVTLAHTQAKNESGKTTGARILQPPPFKPRYRRHKTSHDTVHACGLHH
eukprot:4119563-Pleurochrysis_carterae.AAC.2